MTGAGRLQASRTFHTVVWAFATSRSATYLMAFERVVGAPTVLLLVRGVRHKSGGVFDDPTWER